MRSNWTLGKWRTNSRTSWNWFDWRHRPGRLRNAPKRPQCSESAPIAPAMGLPGHRRLRRASSPLEQTLSKNVGEKTWKSYKSRIHVRKAENNQVSITIRTASTWILEYTGIGLRQQSRSPQWHPIDKSWRWVIREAWHLSHRRGAEPRVKDPI